jgi:hypothetical protein
MTDKTLAQQRQELIDGLAVDGADREHLEAMTDEGFARFAAVMLLTSADKLRELFGDRAEETLRVAAEIAAVGDSRGLRRVTLADGRGVLVDPDCIHTDDEIRAAYEENR